MKPNDSQPCTLSRRGALLCVLCGSLFFTGCACPRRAALATHVRERFTGRADGLVLRETWKDAERGGGVFLFTDPNVQSMFVNHTNQAALGGGSVFTAIIGAGGTALGNVIGASVKAAVK
jgi:hypothetical protein